ncbi:unnamed protein product, partial [Scytosiphon promiscuus]
MTSDNSRTPYERSMFTANSAAGGEITASVGVGTVATVLRSRFVSHSRSRVHDMYCTLVQASQHEPFPFSRGKCDGSGSVRASERRRRRAFFVDRGAHL